MSLKLVNKLVQKIKKNCRVTKYRNKLPGRITDAETFFIFATRRKIQVRLQGRKTNTS